VVVWLVAVQLQLDIIHHKLMEVFENDYFIPIGTVRCHRLCVLSMLVISLVGVVLLRPNGDQSSRTSLGMSEAAADSSHASGSSDGPPGVGVAAPDFTLLNLDGQPVSLSEWRGRPVLINFWASWCGPCQIEMPAIQAVYEKHQEDGFVVLAVAVDDSAKNVRRFIDERGLTFQILMDDGKVSRAYRVFGLPASFFVGADGKIAAVHNGVLTEDEICDYHCSLN
jgi:peroxiredoxin